MKAVDSENNKNLQSDPWCGGVFRSLFEPPEGQPNPTTHTVRRSTSPSPHSQPAHHPLIYRRLHQIHCGSAKPGHPLQKFRCGSLKTLLDDPKARGVDVRDR